MSNRTKNDIWLMWQVIFAKSEAEADPEDKETNK